MKKIKSAGIFDIKDFPINFVRTGLLKGMEADIDELQRWQFQIISLHNYDPIYPCWKVDL